jgi:hypothetical protein
MKIDLTLEENLFAPLQAAMEEPLAKKHSRSCIVLTDELFVRSGVARVLEVVQSGREWVQNIQQHTKVALSASDYFAQLESSRRLAYLEAVGVALQQTQLKALRAKTDRLASIHELDGFEIWAADGHEIEHACHDKRKKFSDGTERYLGINQIFAQDLRTAWVRPLAICDGKEHEIKALKAQSFKALRQPAARGTLLIYDCALIDTAWWLKLKEESQICVISRCKESMRPVHELPRVWDRTDPRNAGVLADEIIGLNNLGQLRRVRYQDPETHEIHTFLTSEYTLPPGIIALLFRLRWDIEKSFDEFENKLAEKKAWATSKTAKTIQSHFTALAYNLLLLALNDLENQHQLRDTKVEEKYERWMERRQAVAEQLARTVNSLVQSVRRISEHSLQILRWLRHHLRARSTLEASLSDAPAYFFSYI